MARSLVGLMALAVLIYTPSVVSAQAAAPNVTITSKNGRVVATLRAENVAVTQTLTANTFDLQIGSAPDQIRVKGDVDGRVSVTRGDRTHAFAIKTARPSDTQVVRDLLANNDALANFRSIASSDWARSTRQAAVFVSADAIVALLQGDSRPTSAMAQRALGGELRIVPAQQLTAQQCWRAYERDVLQVTYDLEACVKDASTSLNPLRLAWCSYEYNIRASLAFIWLLDCSGY